MSPYKQYCQPCSTCSGSTTKAYARKNGGRCKACTTGEPTRSSGRAETRSMMDAEQRAEYRMTEEYRQEVMGFHDYRD